MSEQARELAELVEAEWRFECPKCTGSWFGTSDGLSEYCTGHCKDEYKQGCHWSGSSENCRRWPDYDTDLNAMREVWAVLKERGLWDEFLLAWQMDKDKSSSYWRAWIYAFLNDLPGQITAAIKVLKEAK